MIRALNYFRQKTVCLRNAQRSNDLFKLSWNYCQRYEAYKSSIERQQPLKLEGLFGISQQIQRGQIHFTQHGAPKICTLNRSSTKCRYTTHCHVRHVFVTSLRGLTNTNKHCRLQQICLLCIPLSDRCDIQLSKMCSKQNITIVYSGRIQETWHRIIFAQNRFFIHKIFVLVVFVRVPQLIII